MKSNEILIIYNSNDLNDRKALGYAKSLRKHKLKELDVYKESLSETQIKEVANLLRLSPSSMVNQQSELFIELKKENNLIAMSEEDMLKLLKRYPLLLKTPIAVLEDRAFFLDSSYELIKMDMVS